MIKTIRVEITTLFSIVRVRPTKDIAIKGLFGKSFVNKNLSEQTVTRVRTAHGGVLSEESENFDDDDDRRNGSRNTRDFRKRFRKVNVTLREEQF